MPRRPRHMVRFCHQREICILVAYMNQIPSRPKFLPPHSLMKQNCPQDRCWVLRCCLVVVNGSSWWCSICSETRSQFVTVTFSTVGTLVHCALSFTCWSLNGNSGTTWSAFLGWWCSYRSREAFFIWQASLYFSFYPDYEKKHHFHYCQW